MKSVNLVKHKIAILMATHNGADFIEKQLTSLASQLDVKIHLFVSDDGSTDNTIETIQAFTEKTKSIDVSFINQGKTFGRSSKNFYSLALTVNLDGFDYVAFSDQDDVWFDHKLRTAAKLLEETQSQGYSSDVIAYWPKTNTKKYIKKSYPQTELDHFYEPPGPGCTHVFTVNSFLKFREFLTANYVAINEIDCHDWLAYAYYKENKFKWYIDDNPTMYYYQHSKNEVGVNVGLCALYKRMRKIREGWYRAQVKKIRHVLHQDQNNIKIKLISTSHILRFRRRKVESLFVSLLIIFGYA